jgi:beta-lactamase class A
MKFILSKKEYLYYLVFFAFGILAGYFIFSAYHSYSQIPIGSSIREHDPNYKFIAPFLVSNDQGKQSAYYQGLKNEVNNFIQANIGQNDTVSVYFRDLDKGEWMGVNENFAYAPASLLKTVIMIAYFKKAESDPNVLNQEIQYSSNLKNILNNIEFEDPSKLEIGKYYKVDDLISKMIIDSDNGAMNMLFATLEDSFINEVYSNLGLQLPGDKGFYHISAQSYSLFFRILYNASYINRDLSEKALSILSKANFKDGLIAGVPASLTVAHKYGEYIVGSNGVVNSVELHDCGIVYMPDNPYFLCIMTHTRTLGKDKQIIKSISGIVYNELNK